MQAFIARRDSLLTRALLLLLIATAADVLTMLLIPWLRESIGSFLTAGLFHAWAAPAMLVISLIASLILAAYLWLTAPYRSQRARRAFTVLVAVLTTMHLIGAVWNVVLLTSAVRVATGG